MRFDNNTIPLEITITSYQPATPAQLYGPPENCYPAEDMSLEFEVHTLTSHPLTESDFGEEAWADLCLSVLEAVEDESEEAKSEAAITAYEDRHDQGANW